MRLLIALLSPLACAPRGGGTEAPTYEPTPDAFHGGLTVHESILDNGLRLLVAPDPDATTVDLQVWYGVGSADEEPGGSGLAHLLEHLMFGATEVYEPRDLLIALEGMGAAEPDAWTWLDQTVYTHAFPPVALPSIAAMEAARMQRLAPTEGALAIEREIVRNERRYRVDNHPDSRLNETLWAAAFRGHPYGLPPSGLSRELGGLSLDDAETFYRRWYGPDNATVVISGDLDPAAAADLVEAHFGHLAPVRPLRASPTPAPLGERSVLKVPITAASDRLRLGLMAPRAGNPDLAALTVLDAMLVGGSGSRLRRALVDTGLASEVDTALTGTRLASLWTFAVTAREGVSAFALDEALTAELAAVAAGDFTEAEVTRGRNLALLESLESVETAEGRVAALGWYQTVAGDWRGAFTEDDQLQSVSAQDVRLAAKSWLTPDAAVVLYGLGERPAGEVAVKVTPPANEATPLDARALAGPPALERGDTLTRETHGATVMLDYDPTSPVLRFVMGWSHGAAVEEAPGLAGLAARMTLLGGGYAAEAEALGALITMETTHDTTRFEARVLAARWPEFIALTRRALTEAGWTAAELNAARGEQLGQLTAAMDDDVRLAFQAFGRAWYGPEHPYGRSPLGTASGLNGVTLAEASRFRERWFVSEGMVLGLAGAFDAGAVGDLAALAGALEGSQPQRPPLPEPPPRDGTRVVLVDKPGRSQLQVVLGHEGVSRAGEDWPAAYLANAVFGRRGARGRLSRALRATRGWTYFAYSNHWPQLSSPAWTAHFAPSTDYGVEAAALALQMMRQAASGASYEELEAVRRAEQDAALFMADTAAERLGLATWEALTGDDPLATLKALDQVSSAEVDAALGEMLHPERALIVMVGTAEAIRLRAAALGEVEVIDYTELQ